MARQPTGNPNGRPRKQIDKSAFEKLCGLQCTLDEVCSYFDCDDRAIERFCRETYGDTFAEVFRKKRGLGKISLRRSQWRLAEKNVTMAIFLGKNYLGQTDSWTTSNEKTEDDNFENALREASEKVWRDDNDIGNQKV